MEEKQVKKSGLAAWKVILAVLALVLVAAVVFRLTRKKEEVDAAMLASVSAAVPERHDLFSETSLIGTMTAGDVYAAVAKASGEITKIYVKQGDVVKKGDPLCDLDCQKQIDGAKISMDSAEIQVKNLEESAELARTNLARMEVLYQSGDISRQTYEQTKNGYDQAVAGLEAARLQLDGARLQYDTQVEYATVTAPADGTVDSVSMELNAMAAQGTPVAVISGGARRKLTFNLTDRLLSHVHPGDSVTVTKQGTDYEGRVLSVAALPGQTTGLYLVEAEVNDGGSIAVGASAKVRFETERSSEALCVNTDAVYYDGGKTYVYTVTPDDSFAERVAAGNRGAVVHKVEVTTGLSDENYTELLSGAGPEDLIVRTWTAQLFEGARVQLVGAEG